MRSTPRPPSSHTPSHPSHSPHQPGPYVPSNAHYNPNHPSFQSPYNNIPQNPFIPFHNFAPFFNPLSAYSPGYPGPAPPFAPGWGVQQQSSIPMPYFNPAAPPFHPTAPNQSAWGYGGNGIGMGWSGDQPPGARTDGGRGEDLWSTGEYRSLPRRVPAEDRPSRSYNWRDRDRSDVDRSPSPPPFPAAGSSSNVTTHPNAPPARRQRAHQRSAPLPSPSAHYLAASLLPSTSLPPPAENEAYEPPLLILDLNHTLLCRAARNRSGSKLPLVRPYLATFLEYICSELSSSGERRGGEEERKPRFLPIVFSSARHPNVLSLLTALSLVPASRLALPPTATTYTPSRAEGDVLELIWTREMMGLDARDFARDVETTKDLDGVWRQLGLGLRTARELEETGTEGKEEEEEDQRKERLTKARIEAGARRTILLDDEASKAIQQPYNHLEIAPFIVAPSDFPRPASLSPPPPARLPVPVPDLESSPARPPRRIFGDPDAVPQALELAASSTVAASDAALLSTIYALDLLTRESHIAAALRAGFLERVRGDVRADLERRGEDFAGERAVEEEMQRRGRAVCEALGIAVRREWDVGWRERVVGQERERAGSKEEK
ncbi:hypothetical protein JCM1841_003188 [Sporobolomyces salmonicolor]